MDRVRGLVPGVIQRFRAGKRGAMHLGRVGHPGVGSLCPFDRGTMRPRNAVVGSWSGLTALRRLAITPLQAALSTCSGNMAPKWLRTTER